MQNITNFQKIREFHRSFEHPCEDVPQTKVVEENKKLVNLRLSLINEEFKELKEAVETKDFKEVIDALTDILYVVYGAGAAFGINLDRAYSIVHNSNMTKLAKDEAEAIETVNDYKQKYEEKSSPYDTPEYKLTEDESRYIIKNKSTGKVLKSIRYSKTNFQEILDNTEYTHQQQKSNFEKIQEFHKQFELCYNTVPQLTCFDQDPKVVKLRLSLIEEEIKELEEAVEQNNFIEIIDALADILYVTYGAGCSFGINLDTSFDIVHSSNMTKLCKNENEAKETVEWYKQQFLEKKLPYENPALKMAKTEQYFIVYEQSNNKILKSVNYTPANFELILNSKEKDQSKNEEKKTRNSRSRSRSNEKEHIRSIKKSASKSVTADAADEL